MSLIQRRGWLRLKVNLRWWRRFLSPQARREQWPLELSIGLHLTLLFALFYWMDWGIPERAPHWVHLEAGAVVMVVALLLSWVGSREHLQAYFSHKGRLGRGRPRSGYRWFLVPFTGLIVLVLLAPSLAGLGLPSPFQAYVDRAVLLVVGAVLVFYSWLSGVSRYTAVGLFVAAWGVAEPYWVSAIPLFHRRTVTPAFFFGLALGLCLSGWLGYLEARRAPPEE